MSSNRMIIRHAQRPQRVEPQHRRIANRGSPRTSAGVMRNLTDNTNDRPHRQPNIWDYYSLPPTTRVVAVMLRMVVGTMVRVVIRRGHRYQTCLPPPLPPPLI